MPVQADAAKPIVQINADGSYLPLDTTAPPPRQIDNNGRDVVEEEQQTQQTQEQPPATQTEEQTASAARKLFLQAQKAERKAKEAEKKAVTTLKKAAALEAAIKMTQDGADPTALLTAVGVDPIKFYKDMTTYALSDKAKPEDPVQKELREHKERLDKYAKDLEVQASTIQEKENLAQHNQTISASVIPLLKATPDRWETLISEYGNQAAVTIYKAVWDRYQLDGTVVPFDQAADEIEAYWAEQVENGIKHASKMKKFQHRFAQASSDQRNSSEQKETPSRSSFTLSNKSATNSTQPSSSKRAMTKEERIAEILKKHGAI
jgi:hypothetical protein